MATQTKSKTKSKPAAAKAGPKSKAKKPAAAVATCQHRIRHNPNYRYIFSSTPPQYPRYPLKRTRRCAAEVCADKLLKVEIPPRVELVKDFIEADAVTIVAAEPNAGKTFFVIEMAVCAVTEGRRVLPPTPAARCGWRSTRGPRPGSAIRRGCGRCGSSG